MKKIRSIKISVSLILAGVMGIAGAVILFRDAPDQTLVFGNNPDLPTLTFYTSAMATTPQLPFWSAIRKGSILEKCNFRVVLWKNLDDLRGIMLAGKGDLWLGDTEGFARAHGAGAPVRILMISGWRKFYLVSRNPDITSISDLHGRELAAAPPGGPAVSLLRSLKEEHGKKIRFSEMEPRQLALMLMDGRMDTAIVPEPLLTSLLLRDTNLKIIENIEDYYGRRTGGLPRMPIAGMAVHAKTAEKYPELIASLLDILLYEGKKLEEDARDAVHALPEAFSAFIPQEMVTASLERDRVMVKSALEAEQEIRSYLHILMPAFFNGDRSDFFWQTP
ncbi:NitT/TauT family transport system substrate-binding protein [Desulfobotulus alkaliphilus]|uniref:NitT/TauT family transport system substrate-binding protein n=1 Tax=Desulfobotulus alkaliphilus TaxID=622671 RepID=A0A562RD21_9BACT|nr:ABC transporter substrate-binding protein [Desulfobotulus alkaliphilus]TWI66957.1 NitT/TauT family transport system substrate-binding protein [Desulfobotulus alkaliphilus]